MALDSEISQFHRYSLGIVAANKELSSKIIEVTPIEILTMIDGEINDHASQQTVKGTNADGQAFTASIKMSNTIKATWLPIGSTNRITPPDVRRGEEVMIYRYADTDQFFWTCHKAGIELRRLETIIFAVSDTSDENAIIGAENTYFLEVSTHKGHIFLRTANSNNEYTTYEFHLDCKNGKFLFTDGKKNEAMLDSTENRFRLTTASDAIVDLHDKDLTVTIPGDTKIITTGNTTVNTTGNVEVNTQGNATINTTGANTIIGKSNLIKGNTTIMGNLSFMGLTGGKTKSVLSGDFTIDGDIDQTGNYRVNGNITSTGTVKGSNGDFPNLD